MNCPLCLDSVLDVTFHAGIELDICPTCRGVWLDRGELDRLAAGTTSDTASPQSDRERSRRSVDDRERDRDEHPRDDRRKKKRKKSLASRLGDVFEEVIDL